MCQDENKNETEDESFRSFWIKPVTNEPGSQYYDTLNDRFVRHASRTNQSFGFCLRFRLCLGTGTGYQCLITLECVPFSVSSTLVEPPFHTLGLAHAWPSGWVQAIMEVIHVHGGLTWCATIMTSTILLR